MVHLPSLGAVALTLLPSFVGASWPFDVFAASTVKLTAVDVQKELGPHLSKTAVIYAKDDARFEDATARWQAYQAPTISVVVEAGAEEDIPHIVKFANAKGVPFLVVNTGHGSTATLGKFKGIQISMVQLKKVTVSPDKKSATFQGGVHGGPVIEELWNMGYVTSTGSCGCVGLLGPGLGGGHGRLQGFYGLISDGFISLNVVLEDGTPVIVSDKSHPDLFWAMKGAGHNFGIVTSFEAKIHPRGVDTWYSKVYSFKQDKLEKFHELLNELGAKQPKEIVHWTLYWNDPRVSTTEPVIHWSFEYIGPEKDAKPYLEPFEKLGPEDVSEGNFPYPKVLAHEGTSEQDPICGKGQQHMQFDAGLLNYNITAQRAIFDLFAKKVKHDPSLVYSFVVMEGYSTEGVDTVDPVLSSFALRDDKLLVAINIQYPPNASLDEFAIEWGRQTRALFNNGQPGRKPTTYINYAFGDEPVETIYGYEPWRIEKLRNLKHKYDPHSRFSYFNPITFEGTPSFQLQEL
ncbi:FAD-binding domain-containing protein [Melanomma pulvis-pyrius CBS 109.77]|uniref:FAD-binding domain-containing protein n=1 Tax=Melanomma pulvis-pyrius CBS 109.77 TaxID=1314802 RepID=A0A6A6XTR4_9PLEO|nr:FAD-binding domain-containing protein [Melanomma pulvis-pyrius CBS 109.77]